MKLKSKLLFEEGTGGASDHVGEKVIYMNLPRRDLEIEDEFLSRYGDKSVLYVLGDTMTKVKRNCKYRKKRHLKKLYYPVKALYYICYKKIQYAIQYKKVSDI